MTISFSLSNILSSLQDIEEALLNYPLQGLTDEDIKEYYELAANVHRTAGLIWHKPFLEMCARDMFNKDKPTAA